MKPQQVHRRHFLLGAAASATGAVLAQPSRRSILNFNENMEYRRLGKTGVMVSAVCLGGHWKRIANILGPSLEGGCGY